LGEHGITGSWREKGTELIELVEITMLNTLSD